MSTLNVAKTGLIAFNKAMQMTSHNIANANTVGFTKSVADFKELPSVGTPPIGTGVKFQSKLANVFDKMLDGNLLNQFGNVGFEQGIKDALANIPADAVENITNKLAGFHKASVELMNEPNSPAIKTNFINKAQELTGAINNFNNIASDTIIQVDQYLEQHVDEVNSLSASIAQGLQYNQPVMADLQKLAELVDIEVTDNNGTLQVTTDSGIQLVSGAQHNDISANDITPGIGGYLGGLKRATTETIPALTTLTNDAVSTYMDRVNVEYIQGNDTPLFGRQGSNYTVIPQPNDVNAGTSTLGNDIALNIVGVTDGQNQHSTIKAELLQADLTISNAKDHNVSSLERDIAFLDKLQADRNAKYGVDLDEEAVNLLQYKRAYEAMAKVIKADTEMFNSLLAVV